VVESTADTGHINGLLMLIDQLDATYIIVGLHAATPVQWHIKLER
jgi:hypothetical protein